MKARTYCPLHREPSQHSEGPHLAPLLHLHHWNMVLVPLESTADLSVSMRIASSIDRVCSRSHCDHLLGCGGDAGVVEDVKMVEVGLG